MSENEKMMLPLSLLNVLSSIGGSARKEELLKEIGIDSASVDDLQYFIETLSDLEKEEYIEIRDNVITLKKSRVITRW